jgi:hypothetical protein
MAGIGLRKRLWYLTKIETSVRLQYGKRGNMRLPVIEVNMGDYGVQEIDFNEYMSISSDYVSELHKDASNYAYITTAETWLKKILKTKQLEFDNIKANLTEELTEELTQELGKKPTIKAIDAKLDSDDTIVRYKQEILELEMNVNVVSNMLRAMSMRHSDLKKLVEIRLAEGRMGNVDVNVEQKPVEVKKPVRGGKIKKERN